MSILPTQQLLFYILDYVFDNWPLLAQVHQKWNPKSWLKKMRQGNVVEKLPSLRDFQMLKEIRLDFGNQRAQLIEVSDRVKHLNIGHSNNCGLRAKKLESLTLQNVSFVQNIDGTFLKEFVLISVNYSVLDVNEKWFPHLTSLHIVHASYVVQLNLSKKIERLIVSFCPKLLTIEPLYFPLITYLTLSHLPELQSTLSVPNLLEFSWDQKVRKPLFQKEKLEKVTVDVRDTLLRCCEIPTTNLCLLWSQCSRLPEEIEWPSSLRGLELQLFPFLTQIPKIPSWIKVLRIDRCGLRNGVDDTLQHCDVMLKRGLRLKVDESAYCLVEALLPRKA
jgi:hypothetical protein